MKLFTRTEIHFQHTDFIGCILFLCIDKHNIVSRLDIAVHNLEIGYDTTERIKYGVKNQCLKRSVLISFGSWYTLYYGLEDVLNAFTGLTGSSDNFLAFTTQQVNNLIFHFLRHGIHHITLVDHRNNFQIMVYGHVKIGYGLCLYSLGSIHHQQSAFTGSNRTGHFIRKVHMSRSVNQIKSIWFSFIGIFHLNGMTFDCNATFTFQIHIIQHLPFSYLYCFGKFKQTVG